jgi:release factor glutamine methyltransferase
MKVKEALEKVRKRLAYAGIEEAGLESELLLQYLLCLNSVRLFLEHDEELMGTQSKLLDDLVERRLTGEPLAYILGKLEFFGREFTISPLVLIPRPETEHLVEKAIEIAARIPSPVIADIGTGSGVIAVSLATELPGARIFAVDISEPVLDVARSNARHHGVESRISFLYGDLAEPLPEPVDILIANLPYVKSTDCSGMTEPRLALDGGEQGLDIIERLCAGLGGKLKPAGSVLLEIGQGQEEAVKRLLRDALQSTHLSTIKDLADINRIVWGRLSA